MSTSPTKSATSETSARSTPKLIRLSGDQAATYWPVLSKGFLRSLPPGVEPSEHLVNNMLTGILRRQYDCWVLQVERQGETKQAASAITCVRVDPVSGSRSLLIYSLAARIPVRPEEWKEAFRLLRHVARSARCHRITGYTANQSVMQIVDSVGGNTDMRVIEIGV